MVNYADDSTKDLKGLYQRATEWTSINGLHQWTFISVVLRQSYQI